MQHSNNGRFRALSVGLWLFLALFSAACGSLAGEPQIVSTIPPRTPVPTPASASDELALGAQIFAQRCSSCHGENGQGDGALVRAGTLQNVPDFTDPARRSTMTVEDYYEVITNGRIERMMPPWKDALTDEQRWAVARYAYSLTPQDAPASAEANAALPAEDAPIPEALSVRGSLLNGTAGVPLPDTAPITLYVLDTFGAEVVTLEGNAQAGSFAFEDVPLARNYAYFASAEHQGLTFISQMALARDVLLEEEAQALEITLYEPTEDASVITIDLLLNQAAMTAQGTLEMLLVARFRNSSDRAYQQPTPLEDGRTASVQLHLPNGATPLELDPTRYHWDASTHTLTDTLPVLPDGDHLIQVIYTLPLQQRMEIAYTVDYPMLIQPELMLIPNQFRLQSAQFETQGVMEFSSGTFEDFLAQPLRAGETLAFTLSIPSNNPLQPRPALGITLLIVGALLLSVALGLQIYQRQQRQLADALASQIAALDARHEAQEISTEAYQQLREPLKQQLARLVRPK